jgi:predicted enzyme related to lactoylglutathione lyase
MQHRARLSSTRLRRALDHGNCLEARSSAQDHRLADMEVLSSRILVRPRDLARSLQFYEYFLELPVYREWGEGQDRGVAFFLGGGFLEVSGASSAEPSDAVRVFLQVRDLRATRNELTERGVAIEMEPVLKPWGLFEMLVRDPDGLELVFVEVPPDHALRRRA